MAFWLNLKLFCGSFLVNLVLMDLLLYSLCIVMRICDIYILCCSIFENIFKCVTLCHNVVIWEVCFEKIQVLNDFISDNSKSRNRGFFSRKLEKGTHTCFLSRGKPRMGGRGRVDAMESTIHTKVFLAFILHY